MKRVKRDTLVEESLHALLKQAPECEVEKYAMVALDSLSVESMLRLQERIDARTCGLSGPKAFKAIANNFRNRLRNIYLAKGGYRVGYNGLGVIVYLAEDTRIFVDISYPFAQILIYKSSGWYREAIGTISSTVGVDDNIPLETAILYHDTVIQPEVDRLVKEVTEKYINV